MLVQIATRCSINLSFEDGKRWQLNDLNINIGMLSLISTVFYFITCRFYLAQNLWFWTGIIFIRVYVSVCVCVCVILYLAYLKKFLTDFDEIWQEGL